jgi:hypothetical protein
MMQSIEHANTTMCLPGIVSSLCQSRARQLSGFIAFEQLVPIVAIAGTGKGTGTPTGTRIETQIGIETEIGTGTTTATTGAGTGLGRTTERGKGIMTTGIGTGTGSVTGKEATTDKLTIFLRT